MKIILSPAKKMIVDTDNLAPLELPVYIDKTAEVLNWMKSKSKEELKAIWKCNDKIAEQNFNRLENMNLYNRLRSDLSSDSEYVFERKIKYLFREKMLSLASFIIMRIITIFYWQQDDSGIQSLLRTNPNKED